MLSSVCSVLNFTCYIYKIQLMYLRVQLRARTENAIIIGTNICLQSDCDWQCQCLYYVSYSNIYKCMCVCVCNQASLFSKCEPLFSYFSLSFLFHCFFFFFFFSFSLFCFQYQMYVASRIDNNYTNYLIDYFLSTRNDLSCRRNFGKNQQRMDYFTIRCMSCLSK